MQRSIHRRGAIYRAQHTLSLSLRKYTTVMRISIASNLAYIMEVVFRSLFLIALIFIFGQLWRTTYSARGIQLLSGFSVSDMIWYLVAMAAVIESRAHPCTRFWKVTTTLSTTPDGDVMEDIHERLAEKQMLPEQHLVDTGYVDAEIMAKSQLDHQIDLVGPALPDTSWSSKEAERFDQSQFNIDWEAKSVICPAGQKSRDWGHIPDRHGKPSLRIRFPLPICRSCLLHTQCTPVAAKVVILRLDQQSFQALQEARKRQGTPEFRALYAKCAGIEGTVAQAVRTCEIRRSRYIGLKKLNLQAFLTATSMNVLRACHWLAEEKHAAKPSSRFAKLVASVQ